MSCGDKYAHLLRTPSGLTPADPWGVIPSSWDYDEWYEVDQEIGREVFKRWDWLLAIEDKLTKMRDSGEPVPVSGPYPDRDQLLFLLQKFAASLKDLLHVVLEALNPDGVTWEAAIIKALNVGREGACLLEQLDMAAAYYERPPLPANGGGRGSSGGSSGGESGGIGSVLVTLGLVGAGVYFVRRKRVSK